MYQSRLSDRNEPYFFTGKRTLYQMYGFHST